MYTEFTDIVEVWRGTEEIKRELTPLRVTRGGLVEDGRERGG